MGDFHFFVLTFLQRGETAMMMAAENGKLESCITLFENDADLNLADNVRIDIVS